MFASLSQANNVGKGICAMFVFISSLPTIRMPLLTVWVTGLVAFASAGSETALSPASVMFPLTGVARVSQVGTARGPERKGKGSLTAWIPLGVARECVCTWRCPWCWTLRPSLRMNIWGWAAWLFGTTLRASRENCRWRQEGHRPQSKIKNQNQLPLLNMTGGTVLL